LAREREDNYIPKIFITIKTGQTIAFKKPINPSPD
jgi:hypothetical protein